MTASNLQAVVQKFTLLIALCKIIYILVFKLFCLEVCIARWRALRNAISPAYKLQKM